MKKYFDDEVKTAIRETVKNTKGTGANYFSAKDTSENSFKAAAGMKLRVVDYLPVPAKDGINAHNVVIFDDGHQMSEARFFQAKGIKWPVGGNVGKSEYLIKALENDVNLSVVPETCSTAPLMYANGKFVCRDAAGSIVARDGEGQKKDKVPADAIIQATYTFQPVVFKPIED